MPLPKTSIIWPPPEALKNYALVSEWAAWWTGDPNVLGSFYAGQQTHPEGPSKDRRPFMFWARRGQRNAPSGSVTKLHVPLAGDLATFSADLLFSEEPTLSIPSEADVESGPVTTYLQDLVDDGGLWNLFLESAEAASALGGVYLRAVWDRDLSEFPFLTAIHPDNAVPEFTWGRLRRVTFWEILSEEKKDEIIRHLELHDVENGEAVIRHGLYKGGRAKLGEQIPLESHPVTAALVEGADEGNIDGLDLVVRIPGLDRLDVEYVPNMRPNRRNRGSAEGRSDLEGQEGLLDALDETWTSWMRDIRLGQSRIIVPGEFLEKRGRGEGATFDVDSDIFTPLEIDPNFQEKAGITVVQFTLRTKEHLETCLALIERIVDGAGYSPQSFGLNIEGTAHSGTALKLRERKTFTTQEKKRRYWATPIERITETLLIIARNVLGARIEPDRPTLEWPDTSSPDMSELAQTIDLLKRAVSASTETRVRMLHPDWTDSDVAAEVDRIIEEEGLSVEPPEMVGGIDVPPPGALSDDPGIVEAGLEQTPEETQP